MKLLDINDSGVGEEIANIQVTRGEAEMLFMFADLFCLDNQGNVEISEYRYLRSMLDGILKLWEHRDRNEGDALCV